jgi:thiosulfate reductase cytochrome b subunit
MPTKLRRVRQGLPRVPGGEPWPPPGVIEVEDRPDYLAETAVSLNGVEPVAEPPAPGSADAGGSAAPTSRPTTEDRRVPLRRGLPRTAGGEPWPPPGSGVLTVGADGFDLSPTAGELPTPAAAPAEAVQGASAATPTAAIPTQELRVPLRRGLPRTAGGEPWPSAGFGVRSVGALPLDAPTTDDRHEIAPPPLPEPAPTKPEHTPAVPTRTARPVPTAARAKTGSTAAAATGTNWAGLPAKILQAVRFPALALVGAVAVVGAAFMLASWLISTEAVQGFLARYPGEYPLPEGADPGFPAWVRASHFLNMFFLILIIRTGLQVRYEKNPPAYWTPKWPEGGDKVSIWSWLHQTLDILWLLNGVAFVVLLFVTNHWMRIVPTSWEVFPNALSALLQYLSLDWPTENGWVNYNSLQQLTYFTVIFLAAPLAAITGVRMSGIWPSKAKRLSALYPVELARAVHFPIMLFFVLFVIGHVTMVFATGALKNLNHMFSGTDSTNWAGFWIFAGGLFLIAVVWELARPVILAPIANLLGRVSQR